MIITIKTGDKINTLAGYLIVKDISNGFAEVEEIEIVDEVGTEKSSGIRSLTTKEIEREMKDYDGHNHTVIFK